MFIMHIALIATCSSFCLCATVYINGLLFCTLLQSWDGFPVTGWEEEFLENTPLPPPALIENVPRFLPLLVVLC